MRTNCAGRCAAAKPSSPQVNVGVAWCAPPTRLLLLLLLRPRKDAQVRNGKDVALLAQRSSRVCARKIAANVAACFVIKHFALRASSTLRRPTCCICHSADAATAAPLSLFCTQRAGHERDRRRRLAQATHMAISISLQTKSLFSIQISAT